MENGTFRDETKHQVPGHHEEVMELTHEAKPGYRTAFYIAVIVSVVYLVLVFLLTGH